ncbi:MAG: molybdenum cofactor synthesis domain protein, partial [uncultured archaeon A07HR60]
MDAALITVGEELLCGDIANTNATWLCGSLDERGVRVQRITTIPDEVAEIARVVNEYRAVYDAVVVTGGLGPTHDDVTMEGVAAAVGQDLAHNEAAASWLAEHRDYAAEDLDPGTTQIPAQARMLPNEVGVAPGAVVEGVYVFPGVPAEMEAMFNR